MVRQLQNRLELAELFKELGYTTGAEVGVAEANYSIVLLDTIPDLKLFCVDTWEPYKGNQRGGGVTKQHGNYEITIDKLSKYIDNGQATIKRGFSIDMAREIPDESLDFVYIDANHDFDYVMEDLIHWGRKVKKGGIIAGHDYYHFTNSGVVEAVDAYIKGNNIRNWCLTHEREGSFYFFKEDNHPIKVKGWKSK